MTQILIATLVVLAGFSTSAFAETNSFFKRPSGDKGYYLVPNQFMRAAKNLNLKVLEKRQKESLVKMSMDEVERLSHVIHDETGACGGFEDVTNEVSSIMKRGSLGARSLIGSVTSLAERKVLKSKFKRRSIRHLKANRWMIKHINKSRFATDLNRLVQFPDRSARTKNGVKAAQWLKDEVEEYAKSFNRTDVATRYIETGRRYKQNSVVVKIKGQSSSEGGGVLMGGHMDTFRRNKPGADDDGSGTITVMEIFKSIIDSKVRFKEDIYFAFYAAEEVGLVGSKQVVKTFVKEKIKLQAVLQFDMTGFKSPKEDKYIHFIDDNININTTKFARELAMKVLDIPADKIGKTRCGYACSDHASWHKKGYATVYPFESSFENYNKDIHTSRDNIALIDMDHAIRFAKLGMAFVSELAGPIKPAR